MNESEREQARYGWLTTEQFGELAGGVCTYTVRQWIKQKKVRALNIGTEQRPRYRIKQEWADEYMEKYAA